MRRILSALLVVLAGCGGPDTRRYVCERDSECAAGFSCSSGTCVANDGGISQR